MYTAGTYILRILDTGKAWQKAKEMKRQQLTAHLNYRNSILDFFYKQEYK